MQLFYIIFVPIHYSSDSLNYYQLAQDCLKLHSFYPAPNQVYLDYITAPLYINLLILLLSIKNSTVVIGLLNIILNFIQLLLVFKITEKIFDEAKAETVVLIYIFYLSTLGMILLNLTELLFMVMALGSVYFYLTKNIHSLFISGVLAGLALAVRPTGWALIAAFILNTLMTQGIFSVKLKEVSFLVLGIAVFVGLFGLFTYSGFGRFIYTANNGPVNLLIGANKDATGAYNAKVFEKGNAGYIEHPELLTYYEKEDFWFKKAKEYIISHPVKWISLFPMKVVHIFIWDDVSIHKLANFNDWNLYRIAKSILITRSTDNLLGNKPLIQKIFYVLLLFFHHLYYFSIISLFVFIIFKYYKEILKNNTLRLLLLFILGGISIHLLTFGDARFKYPYIITMMIFISPAVFTFIHNKTLSAKNMGLKYD